MPISGDFTNKLEMLCTYDFNSEDQWNAGSHSNTEVYKYTIDDGINYNINPKYGLRIASNGKAIQYQEFIKPNITLTIDQQEFNTELTYCIQKSNVIVDASENVNIMKITPGQTSGYRIIAIDLKNVNKFGRARAYLPNTQGVTYQVSKNAGSNWITPSNPYYSPGPQYTLSNTYSLTELFSVDEDISDTILWIKQIFTGAGANCASMLVEISPSYKSSGTWISDKIPLSDVSKVIYNGFTFYNSSNKWSGITNTTTVYYSIDDINWFTSVDYFNALNPLGLLDHVNKLNNKFFRIKVIFNLNDTRFYEGLTQNNVNLMYWAELFCNQYELKENLNEKIQELNLKTLTTRSDATWEHFHNNGAYGNIIKLTQINDAITKKFFGVLISKPKITKLMTQEYIDIKCYDAKFMATRVLVNDVTPKGRYYAGLDYLNGSVLSYSVANLWKTYGDPRVHVGGKNQAIIQNNINLTNGELYVDSRVKVKNATFKYVNLFDILNEICDDDDYTWDIIENTNVNVNSYYYPLALELKPKGDVVISNIELNSLLNIVGIPNIAQDDDLSDIANVVIVPTTTRKVGFEQVNSIKQNITTYYMQYNPIARNIGLANGDKIWLDPEPIVYLYEGGNWVAKITVPHDSTQTSPTPQAYYNLEQKWIKLVTNPSSDVYNGLKIVYTVSIPNTIILKNEDSIDYFGKIHHYITGDYSKEEAYKIADQYLFEHAFPVSPVTLETTEWGVNIGEYIQVTIPEQGISQIMPIIEKKTSFNGVVSKVELVLNKAPVQDREIIIDIFKRIQELEKNSKDTSASLSAKTQNANDVLYIRDTITINGNKVNTLTNTWLWETGNQLNSY